jgi:lambda repressor-like predicted transcriptional regulator
MANRFSERVKLLMSKHGWSMRDLSRQSGIPYSTIYDVLAGVYGGLMFKSP